LNEHEDNRVIAVPKWLAGLLASVFALCVMGGLPWCYTVGTDVTAIKTGLEYHLKQTEKQDIKIEVLDERVDKLESTATRNSQRLDNIESGK
jgi:hypothetical protein